VATSASQQRGRFHVMTERGSRSEQETGRALITPDEVRRLGPLEMLAIVGEMQPLRVQQRRWYQDGQVRGRAGQADPAAWRRAEPLAPPDADADLTRTRPATVEDAELDWERAVAAAARGEEVGTDGAGKEPDAADPPSATPAAAPGPVEPDLISH
jgi:type IV secretory pathway TraG/TraD family ATPase VirD4